MRLDRRSLLAAAPALFAAPARAEAAPPELVAYERASGGRAGLYVHDLKTGRKLAWRADERFLMCSTFKMSLVADVLRRIDRGQERLDRIIPYGPKDLFGYAPVAKANLAKGGLPVEEMCRAAVELSDNTCANLLLAGIGGPVAMTAFWREVGDPVTRLDHFELALNISRPGNPEDTTTPEAMTANLRRFLLGDVLSPASRQRLTGWMVGGQTGANRLRAGLPASWRIGDKTGNNAADAAGDLVIAWPAPDHPILVSAYVQGGTPTPDQITGVFTAIGRRVGRELG